MSPQTEPCAGSGARSVSREPRRGCAQLRGEVRGWSDEEDLPPGAPPPGRQTSHAATFLHDSFRIGLAVIKAGRPHSFPSSFLPPHPPLSTHPTSPRIQEVFALHLDSSGSLLELTRAPSRPLPTPHSPTPTALQRPAARGDPSPSCPQRPARGLGVRVLGDGGGGENSFSSCSNWTNIPENRPRCENPGLVWIFPLKSNKGPRIAVAMAALEGSRSRKRGHFHVSSRRWGSRPPPPYLLRCTASPRPAVHTRALQKPGPHRRYLHNQATLPSSQDVYLNFKWRDLLERWKPPGSQGPLTTRFLEPSVALCPEDNDRSGRRAGGREEGRGGPSLLCIPISGIRLFANRDREKESSCWNYRGFLIFSSVSPA